VEGVVNRNGVNKKKKIGGEEDIGNGVINV
jgi:hypothetical protein